MKTTFIPEGLKHNPVESTVNSMKAELQSLSNSSCFSPALLVAINLSIHFAVDHFFALSTDCTSHLLGNNLPPNTQRNRDYTASLVLYGELLSNSLMSHCHQHVLLSVSDPQKNLELINASKGLITLMERLLTIDLPIYYSYISRDEINRAITDENRQVHLLKVYEYIQAYLINPNINTPVENICTAIDSVSKQDTKLTTLDIELALDLSMKNGQFDTNSQHATEAIAYLLYGQVEDYDAFKRSLLGYFAESITGTNQKKTN